MFPTKNEQSFRFANICEKNNFRDWRVILVNVVKNTSTNTPPLKNYTIFAVGTDRSSHSGKYCDF